MHIRFVTDPADLAECLRLRHEVFVLEQGVSLADEADGRDGEALHLLASDDRRSIGAARILIADGTAKIGRVCVLRDARGTGLGGRMLAVMLERLQAEPEVRRAKLGSQVAAISLYTRAGFMPVGPRYMEAGLEHQDMERAV
ncbi:GNAT family N-acetyltransferase [Roseobacter sp. HKCCA0434]|uniref:GNAT family N-acetyltransferase n=1 Tax=Roseobacter sp. HKCCA0434 TaxID=3079297 RepID=UPI002905C9D7|nr:GNAT family N-acetyltransferase [Roseobacter sp. HKCCA0434]